MPRRKRSMEIDRRKVEERLVQHMEEFAREVARGELGEYFKLHSIAFERWFKSEGVDVVLRRAMMAKQRGAMRWIDNVNVYALALIERGGWRLVKNIFVAWLVANGYLSTYRANKLAGGAGGWYEWYKLISHS